MVFSNELMLKQKNLSKYNTITPDIINLLSLDPLKAVTKAKEMAKEAFYTPKEIDKKYRFDEYQFETMLSIRRRNFVFDNVDNEEKFTEEFKKQYDKYGEKLYKDLRNFLSGAYLASSAEATLSIIKNLLMAHNGDIDAAVNKYIHLETEAMRDVADYLRNKKRTVLFDEFKKEYLDNITSTSDKLDAVAKFIYLEQCLFKRKVEKAAVDYYLEKSGYSEVYNFNYTAKELKTASEDAENWLREHNNAAEFLDLEDISSLNPYFKLVYKLIDTIGFNFYIYRINKETDVINHRRLSVIFALLNRNSELYNNNNEFKDFLICLSYALWPIIQHGYRITSIGMGSRILYEKTIYQYNNLVSANLKNNGNADSLKKQLEEKQESLNKLQLKYDRLKNKELEKLKADLEEKTALLKEQYNKNKSLQEMNSILQKQLEEVESAAEDSSSDASINYPSQYIENRLKNLNIVIMGGHQLWQNKLKEIYPYFNYIDTDNVNFDINITRNADFVFFNTLHCSHTLFYRIKNNVNNGRTNNKEKLIFVGSNNLGQFKDVVSKAVTEGKR